MKHGISQTVLSMLLAALVPLHALSQPAPVPRDVVQFSATAEAEALQDQLTVILRISRDGPEPLAVQEQLKATLEAALADARSAAQPGVMDVRTGQFSLMPRHGRDGRISGWQGTADLILQGRDFGRISSVAARIQGMTVASVAFALSREQRERLESQAQARAIERYRARAGEIARAFGFSGYTLRELALSSSEQGPGPRPRLLAMEARSSIAEAPLPVEAGKATVLVTVSGSVQLK